MKILLINSSKKWGGNERWSVSAAKGLKDAGHTVYFACKTNIFDSKLPNGIIKIKAKFSHELDLATYLKLIQFVLNHKIQIIIPTKRKEYGIAGIIGKLLDIPVYFRLGIVRKIAPYKIAQRLIYGSFATGIICNSLAIKKQLIKDNILPSEKIHVVYNGYDFDTLKLSMPDNETFTFACAGRLTPQKGFDILLEAIKILKNKTENFQVKIAGEGHQYQQLTDYIRINNLQQHVDLLGHIDITMKFIESADAIIIPSRNEGIPNVLMEAWSLKKTVLAAMSAGIPEAVTDNYNGLLVELKPDCIADKMLYVMNNNTNILGKNGHKTLKRKFSFQRMVKDLEQVCMESLEKKHHEKVNL